MDKQKILTWEVEKGLLNSAAVTNRDSQVKKLLNKTAEDVFLEYSYHTSNEMVSLYGQVVDILTAIDIELKGVGLEAGSGVCGFSTNICNFFKGIDKIYAVELVPTCSTLARDITIPFICGNDFKKIVSVIGSFDNIELDDNSVDFCIEVESFHHSDNLKRSLKEVHRVLKDNGLIVLLDRSHNDSLSEEQREYMLNVQYEKKWLEDQGYDDAKLSRRENGEHEIKQSEWISAFNDVGFELISRHELRSVSIGKLIKGIIYLLPFKFRKLINFWPSRVKFHDNEIGWIVKELLGIKQKNKIFKKSVRDYTLFVIKKA